MSAYYTPKDSYTANNASFIRLKLATYTTRYIVFSINSVT